MLEGVSLSFISLVVSTLGIPGLAMVFWWVDQRRADKMMQEHKKELGEVLDRYRDDMAKVTRYYEDNVLLVKGYERLAGDLASIIHLNTQAQTHLVEQIKNNMFCPMIREKGPRA
jgi:glucose-6-phosphate dehydrogenase assembly protein OpcA